MTLFRRKGEFFSTFRLPRKKMMKKFVAHTHKKTSRLPQQEENRLLRGSTRVAFVLIAVERAQREPTQLRARAGHKSSKKKEGGRERNERVKAKGDGRRLWPRPEEQAAQGGPPCGPLGEGKARQEQRSVLVNRPLLPHKSARREKQESGEGAKRAHWHLIRSGRRRLRRRRRQHPLFFVFFENSPQTPPSIPLLIPTTQKTKEAGPTRASIKSAPGRQGKQQRLQASKALR